MATILANLIGAALLTFVVWLLIPSAQAKPQDDEDLIDPEDSRQIGLLIGLAGGKIADAATARFALKQFEQIQGRKATIRDVGVVLGLMSGGGKAT
jgi:hypothetical protein